MAGANSIDSYGVPNTVPDEVLRFCGSPPPDPILSPKPPLIAQIADSRFEELRLGERVPKGFSGRVVYDGTTYGIQRYQRGGIEIIEYGGPLPEKRWMANKETVTRAGPFIIKDRDVTFFPLGDKLVEIKPIQSSREPVNLFAATQGINPEHPVNPFAATQKFFLRQQATHTARSILPPVHTVEYEITHRGITYVVSRRGENIGVAEVRRAIRNPCIRYIVAGPNKGGELGPIRVTNEGEISFKEGIRYEDIKLVHHRVYQNPSSKNSLARQIARILKRSPSKATFLANFGSIFGSVLAAVGIIKGYEYFTGKEMNGWAKGGTFIGTGLSTAISAKVMASQGFSLMRYLRLVPGGFLSSIPISTALLMLESDLGISPEGTSGMLIGGVGTGLIATFSTQAALPASLVGALGARAAAGVGIVGGAIMIGKGVLVGASLLAGYGVGKVVNRIPDVVFKKTGIYKGKEELTYSNLIASGLYAINSKIGDPTGKIMRWLKLI